MKKILLLFVAIHLIHPSDIICQSQTPPNYCDLFQTTVKLYNESDIFPVDITHFNELQFESDFLGQLDPDFIIFDSAVNPLLYEIGKSIMFDLHEFLLFQ